ncbi:MAG: tRNA (N6-threonylcarbamoyladenosine(37)-N6)-methyltransferase TrmO [Candidatus Bathyarchaeota archaeon]|nr:tRNA (N6-threonylcarbamoyladenosine(37)-N6)-methyltransferase TrmO [Candidatus Bathyarchaeota archaeon]
MSCEGKVIFEPIGFVSTSASETEIRDKTNVSTITINEELAEGLEGITGFSHLFVLFYLNQLSNEQRKTLKVHPRGRTDLPLTGVFATRTMLRKNPIGLTVVELLSVTGNVLTVRGLDAYDGTPVLDLKPYDPWDNIENIKVPDWWKKLEKEKASELK